MQAKKRLFDFIKIDKDHPLNCIKNTDVIGFFKIETPDTIYMEENCALRSKAYAYKKHNIGVKRGVN